MLNPSDQGIYYIDAEEPYNQFPFGKIYIDKGYERRMIRLYGGQSKAYTTTYARYLFQVDYWNKHGLLIPDGYEVDHINENKLDDCLENFRLLTVYENRQKNNYFNGSKKYVLCCPVCGILFVIEPYNMDKNSVVSCSEACDLSIRVSLIPRYVRDHLVKTQIKNVVKIYKEFPSGEEYKCEILIDYKDCFYPHTLKDCEKWLPRTLRKDWIFVNVAERDEKVNKLRKKGLSERNISQDLGISRVSVRSSLRRLGFLNYRSK